MPADNAHSVEPPRGFFASYPKGRDIAGRHECVLPDQDYCPDCGGRFVAWEEEVVLCECDQLAGETCDVCRR